MVLHLALQRKMTNHTHPFLYRKCPKLIGKFTLNHFVATFVLSILPFILLGQKFDDSFIQYNRAVEDILVLETEGQRSWINESNNDTLHWIKDGLVIEEMPRMPGCEHIKVSNEEKRKCATEKLLQYIYSNLVYPIEALEDRIEGQIIVTFFVNPDGKLSNAKVKEDVGFYTAGAALDLINKMSIENTWVPGKSKGIAVPTLYALPIKFKLGPENTVQHPQMYSKYYDTNNEWELIYDTENESTLNEETEVRMLISDNGKVLNVRVLDRLSLAAQERANEIILDLLDNSTWRPGSTYSFENTMEFVFTLKM